MTAPDTLQQAIERSLSVYRDPEFVAWATAWLSGADRTAVSALELAKRIEAASWAGDGEWTEGNASQGMAEDAWAEPSALMGPRSKAAVYAARAAAALANGRHDQAETLAATALRLAEQAASRGPSSRRTPDAP